MFKVSCPNCHHENRPPQVVCEACAKILPFYTMNPFVVFQLTPSEPIDMPSLDTKYFNLQRLIHPDRVQTAENKEWEWVNQHIGQINHAYKALKHTLPRAKAAYLYIKDPSLSIEAFDNADLPMPEISFLQQIIQLQACPSSNDIKALENSVLKDLVQSIMVLNSADIVQGIAKLTYVERLHTMSQENSRC